MSNILTIIVPARGSDTSIINTVNHAEQVAQCVSQAGFKTSVLVADNRLVKRKPLDVSPETLIYDAGDLLAFQNFRFGLSQCESEFGIFLSLSDSLNSAFITKALKRLCEDRGVKAVLGAIDSGVGDNRQTAFSTDEGVVSTGRFCQSPFGWGIYSIFHTETMKSIFVNDTDWTDYVVTGELCKNGLFFLTDHFRYYPIPEDGYIVKSQRRFLNPIPWVLYYMTLSRQYSRSPFVDITRTLYATSRNYIKWCLNGIAM